MTLLFRLLIFFVLVVPLALAGATIFAISAQPTISRSAEISPDNIARAKDILEKNDPRKLTPGAVRTITVNQKDFDLAANYLVHQYVNGNSRAVLSRATIDIDASIRLPANPIGDYVNVHAILKETGAIPRLERLQIGRLPVPERVADWLLHRTLAMYLGKEAYESALDAIKQVRVSDDRIALTYQWQANLPETLRRALLPREHQERIRVYQARLVDVSRSLAATDASLVEFVIPLFKLAETRSRGGDPIAESRTALLVLTFYVNGKGFTRFIPAAKDWPHPVTREVTLNGRPDLAQHFMVSAAIAANAGGQLSDAVGLYKEIADARDGSGFSFNDIAADRAGTRFGELAAGSEVTASKLQKQVSAGVNERDLMPETEDLPEYMPEAEFRRRFGGVAAPEYNRMMAEIERRIAALTLYR